jgi:hypothetical protein
MFYVRIRVWLAMVAVACAAAACSTAATVGNGTVTGTMTVTGGAGPGRPRPLPGEIRLINVASGAQTTYQVGADGQYRVSVAAGTYRISCESPQIQGGAFKDQSGVIDVTAGHTTPAVCGFDVK